MEQKNIFRKQQICLYCTIFMSLPSAKILWEKYSWFMTDFYGDFQDHPRSCDEDHHTCRIQTLISNFIKKSDDIFYESPTFHLSEYQNRIQKLWRLSYLSNFYQKVFVKPQRGFKNSSRYWNFELSGLYCIIQFSRKFQFYINYSKHLTGVSLR